LRKTLFTSHVLQGALGYGQFLYSNRPTIDAWQDNNNTALYTGRTAYIKNYRVGGSPQLVGGFGYKYNAKKFWFAGIYLSYFDQIYLDVNPDRRTEESVDKYFSNEEAEYKRVIDQEKLPSYFTLNANGGKSWRLAKKYFLSLNLSVNNILNSQKNITSGFEQLRWDVNNVDKFDNKYFYMQGITYMGIINFSF
jgi:hypothetical protein